MSALALSVILSFVSAVAYAGGAIVQEQVAASSSAHAYAPLRRPAWWASVALNGLGALLHVVALAYGPLSLVQPLGALTIVFALPMAAVLVRRRAGAAAWRGALMATIGLAGLLALVGASDGRSLDSGQRAALAAVTAAVLLALVLAGRAARRQPALRSILLATGSGVSFGMSSVFTKTVAVDWTSGPSLSGLPTLAAIGVFATAGVLLSQASYRGAGLAAPLATLTVVNPVAAAAVGITMFGETFRYGTTGTVLALVCGALAAAGLVLLTTERMTREADEAAAAGLPDRPVPGQAVPAPSARREPVLPGQAAWRAEAPRDAGSGPAGGTAVLVGAPAAEDRYAQAPAVRERVPAGVGAPVAAQPARAGAGVAAHPAAYATAPTAVADAALARPVLHDSTWGCPDARGRARGRVSALLSRLLGREPAPPGRGSSSVRLPAGTLLTDADLELLLTARDPVTAGGRAEPLRTCADGLPASLCATLNGTAPPVLDRHGIRIDS